MNQLELNLDNYDATNNAGVYIDCEAIRLESAAKGWRGVPIAEIRVANTPHGYDWGVSLHLSNSGFCYMPNEKHITCRSFASSRADAIKRAAQEILRRITGDVTFSSDKNAATVRSWIDAVTA